VFSSSKDFILQDARFGDKASTESFSFISNEMTALRMDLIDSSRSDCTQSLVVSRVSITTEASFSNERIMEDIEKKFFVRFTSAVAGVSKQYSASPCQSLMVVSASFYSKSNAGTIKFVCLFRDIFTP
jgi:hypothetical protein